MSKVEELENAIKELENRRLELLKQLELEKLTQEIEFPFKKGDEYFVIEGSGRVIPLRWTPESYYSETFLHGNAFHSKQEAERECNRRILLTKFRQFRDKCNRDFNPADPKVKYYILFDYEENELWITWNCIYDNFNPFGYFKNKEDAQHAIELFGDEIKRLWVEE